VARGLQPVQIANVPMGMIDVGTLRPGGAEQIVSGTQASPTEITTLNTHGLTSGDTIFFTASTTANAALTAVPQQVVTVTSSKKFTVPVNCSVAGATAGAYDYSILSIPVTPGNAPLVNVGRAHGLRVGDTVTIVASGSTPSLDGAQIVTSVPSATSFRVLTSAVPTTVAGSTTAAHYSKTTFYSDVLDRKAATGGGAVVITSTIGTLICGSSSRGSRTMAPRPRRIEVTTRSGVNFESIKARAMRPAKPNFTGGSRSGAGFMVRPPGHR